MERVRREWLLLLVVALVAAVLGFGVGTWRSGAHFGVGRGDTSAEGDGSIITDDWTYGFAADVSWRDTAGTWHDGDQPECLQPGGPSAYGLRFAWTEVTVEGATWRPVVWVDCGSVAQ